MLGRVMRYIQSHGAAYTVFRAKEMLSEKLLRKYDKYWRTNAPTDEELAYQRAHLPACQDLISIAIPVYNTRPELLIELAESLVEQTWPHWEACLYDGCSPNEETRRALQKVSEMDTRLRVCFGEANDGIAGNTNHALDMAKGQWIALCDHDDLLTPDALWQVARVIAETDAELIYSDEDKINEDGSVYHSPNFKPDFCPDNLRSGNYVCHLMVMSRDLIERAGRFRPGYDGSQDHDLTLRCIEQTDRIVHIPSVLYHWRTLKSSVSHSNLNKCTDAACRAVEDHINRIGWPGKVENVNGQPRIHYDTKVGAKIDIIAVESGDPQLWASFYHSMNAVSGPDVRFTVISPWKDSAKDIQGCRWIEWKPQESIYACMNRAAAAAEGEFLVFLHGAVNMQGDTWLNELQMYAQRNDVGAVTPVITTNHGTILHGGFAVGMEGIVKNRGAGLPQRAGGWHGMMTTSYNVAAVSAACLMIRKDHFIPFDEIYTSGLGCVDWCLQLTENGLRHVYTPHAVGRLHDTVIRNWLLPENKIDEKDAALFHERWGREVKDPCYSDKCNRKKADWALPEA